MHGVRIHGHFDIRRSSYSLTLQYKKRWYKLLFKVEIDIHSCVHTHTYIRRKKKKAKDKHTLTKKKGMLNVNLFLNSLLQKEKNLFCINPSESIFYILYCPKFDYSVSQRKKTTSYYLVSCCIAWILYTLLLLSLV